MEKGKIQTPLRSVKIWSIVIEALSLFCRCYSWIHTEEPLSQLKRTVSSHYLRVMNNISHKDSVWNTALLHMFEQTALADNWNGLNTSWDVFGNHTTANERQTNGNLSLGYSLQNTYSQRPNWDGRPQIEGESKARVAACGRRDRPSRPRDYFLVSLYTCIQSSDFLRDVAMKRIRMIKTLDAA